MEVTIQLDKTAILQEVDKITGYTSKNGEAETSKDRIDQIATSADELNILESFYYDGVSYLAESLQSYNTMIREAANSNLELVLNLPSSFDHAGNSFMLNKTARSYVANFISGKWFNVVKKDETQFYVGESLRIIQGLKRILTTRKKPI